MIKNLIVLQIILPIFISAINFVNKKPFIAYYLTLITVITSFASAILLMLYSISNASLAYYFGGWMPPIGIEFKLTKLNSLFLLIVASSALFTFLYGKKILYFEVHKNKISPFCSVFLVCLAGLYGIILTNDFFNLYVFIEIASLTTYSLISIGTTKKSLHAAFYYLIIGTIAATLILISIGYIYAASGTLNIDDFINNFDHLKNLKSVKVACYLMFIGLFIKSGLFPFHSWLVKAYRHTNSFILPFIGSVSTKVYILIVLKLVYLNFGTEYILQNNILQAFLMTIGITAIIIAAFSALQQTDLRSMLVFSSISQIGYIFIAISIGTKTSFVSAVVFTLSHIIAKMALFIICGQVYYYKNTYDKNNLYMLYKEMPYMVTIFLINAASLIGIPLTAGFLGKASIIYALLSEKMWISTIFIVIGSFITFRYFWQFTEIFLFYKKYPPQDQLLNNHDSQHENTALPLDQAVQVSSNYAPVLVVTILTIINIAIGVSFNKFILEIEKILTYSS